MIELGRFFSPLGYTIVNQLLYDILIPFDFQRKCRILQILSQTKMRPGDQSRPVSLL